ncbi:MAG: MotA/TolQ/ExbB proton channel family protein [Planctomycetota bacterium]|nr:MotA/TolQ/ExbB proton channel family protein [Planctomycetota bacterium]MDA1143166.1 MotA/TolQ/ExbB proton channel family protein [Planctomycetota bacterium]
MKHFLFVALAILFSTAQGEDGTTTVPTAANKSTPPADSRSGSDNEIDNDTLLGQFKAGGVWMYPILVCSFICMAFALERLVNVRGSKIIPSPLLHVLENDLKENSLADVKDKCLMHPSCLGRVLLAGLERAGMPLAEMERVADEQSARELYGLRKNIKPLGIVASITPMIGLLGTVNGMISAFRVVAEHGAVGDPKLLSGSISKALLTTGFGLMIAIPALLLHHHFRGKAENLIVEISEITNRVFIHFEDFDSAAKGMAEVKKEQEVA